MKRCGHKQAPHAQITRHFYGAKEMQCQKELINQAMIKTGSFRIKINKLPSKVLASNLNFASINQLYRKLTLLFFLSKPKVLTRGPRQGMHFE